ncbi:Calcium/calmodulin-dependent 3',5'-cyclic nucleotide phosphodiesterase 1C [Acipenser ruthenus]|uniref:Calcium/calmodulin-dependent 3',5'-cyclic nucleotide phosphodiesterase 1C n=1 Tax=Acipenser ruthenus TaxID=7906 RepID=A0A444V6T7_ACIRT|nr:Calcium/calmodulin-dependent 3',5'-cyclic nucleotide phosphodiesterase 1C [Acipenser ruthenus]
MLKSEVANETGETNARPLARFTRSKSQNTLWNAITAGIGIKDKEKRGIVIDPRNPEEILADELPSVDSADAMEKTAIRSASFISHIHQACLGDSDSEKVFFFF